jgi:hypothetical protein
MVGHKLGEFAPTRQFKGHTTRVAERAAAAAAAAAPGGPGAAAGGTRRRERAEGGSGEVMIQAKADGSPYPNLGADKPAWSSISFAARTSTARWRR